MRQSAKVELDRVTPLGEDTADSWGTWTVQPNEGAPFNMKSLFVWKRTGKGWRIVADMYASGVIAK